MGPLTSVSQNLIRNHHHQVSEVGCYEYDCSRISLRYEATQLDMFKHMGFEGNIWYHADQTRAPYIAQFLSIESFSLSVFLNLAPKTYSKMVYFRRISMKLKWKVVNFQSQIQ